MTSQIPLDLGFRSDFTDPRPGERTPTGPARGAGSRPESHRRSRGAAASGQDRTPATSDRAPGNRGDEESASGAGNCDGVGSDRAHWERWATETCWVRLGQPGRSRRDRPGVRATAGNGGRGSEPRIWGHPNWPPVRRFRLAPGPMARFTGSAWNGDNGPQVGQPAERVTYAASPAAPATARRAMCRSRRRLTPVDRPVVDLSDRDAPGAPLARAGDATGALCFSGRSDRSREHLLAWGRQLFTSSGRLSRVRVGWRELSIEVDLLRRRARTSPCTAPLGHAPLGGRPRRSPWSSGRGTGSHGRRPS